MHIYETSVDQESWYLKDAIIFKKFGFVFILMKPMF